VVFGSAKYSAPEAFRAEGRKAADSTLDSYVLGFIFYEIFLGSRLFRLEFAGVEDGSPSAWWTWHANESAVTRPLTELSPGFPQWLSMLVASILRKDPSQRVDLKTALASLSGAIEKTIVNKSRLNLGAAQPPPAPAIASERRDDGASLRDAWNWWHAAFVRFRRSAAARSTSAAVPKPVKHHREKIWFQTRRVPLVYLLVALFVAVSFGVAISSWRKTQNENLAASTRIPTLIETDSGIMFLVEDTQSPLQETPTVGRSTTGSPRFASFYLDKFEVSNKDYLRFCRATGHSLPSNPSWDPHYLDNADLPVLNVSWADASAFASWGGKWLPSPGEWRAAMRMSRRRLEFGPAIPGAVEWVDADFRDSRAGAGAGQHLIEPDLPNGSFRFSEPKQGRAITFRCAVGLQILETDHVLKRFSARSAASPR
jgi:serine/threonine protein kinase